MRSKQSIGWAKKAATAPSSAQGYDDAIPVSKTRRIFVYVIGGITHRHAPSPEHLTPINLVGMCGRLTLLKLSVLTTSIPGSC